VLTADMINTLELSLNASVFMQVCFLSR